MALTQEQIDTLVAAGKITPAQGKILANSQSDKLSPENQGVIDTVKNAVGNVVDKFKTANLIANPLATAAVTAVTSMPKVINRGEAILKDPQLRQEAAMAMKEPNLGNAVLDTGRAVLDANERAATPSSAIAAGMAAGAIKGAIAPDDDQPTSTESAAPTAPAAPSPGAAGGSGAGGVSANNSVSNFKTTMRNNFDGYIRKPADEKIAAVDAKGVLLDKQGHEASNLLLANGQQELDRQNQDQAELAKERDVLKQKLADIDKINNDLANTKLDANKWFSSMAAPNKLLFSLAAVFGGNRHDIFGKMSEQEIQRQKDEYEMRKDGVNKKMSLYGRYYELLGDKEKALAASRLALSNWGLSKINAMQARQGGELGKANAEIAKKELEAERDKQAFQLEASLNPPPSTGGSGSAGLGKLEGEVTAYASDLEKANIPVMEANLNMVQTVMNNGGNFLGPVGKYIQSLPGGTVAMGYFNKDGSLNEQGLENLALQRRHMLTGQASSTAEDKKIAMTIWGDRSPEAIRRGLADIRQETNARKASIAAGHRPEVIMTHELRKKAYSAPDNASQPAPVPGTRK